MSRCSLFSVTPWKGRGVLAWLVVWGVSGSLFAEEVVPKETAVIDAVAKIAWYDATKIGVEGKAWTDTASFYDRLPARAEGRATPSVWGLSKHSAGMAVRFRTDSRAIHARWKLRSQSLAMPHMPATGVSGVDLYGKGDDGRWSWIGAGRPTEFPSNTAALAGGLPAGEREYLVYLPLYNGVEQVELGFAPDAVVKRAVGASQKKPLVFYGTSITHGGCASRPGMAYPAILGRRFDQPTVNLGFSGSGKMEIEMAEFLGEIDASVFVLDTLPNMTPEVVAERAAPFVRKLRTLRPHTPIALCEDRTLTNARWFEGTRVLHDQRRAALRTAFDTLTAEGTQGLTLIDGPSQLGEDGEDTVDGSHPTDLGFLRQADRFEKTLREILPKS
jgi:hypothetical protein